MTQEEIEKEVEFIIAICNARPRVRIILNI